MNKITMILAPREGVSDDTLRIVAKPVPDGQRVKAGQIVMSLESSKAVFDVEAPCEGLIYLRGAVGEDVPSFGAVGVIADEELTTPYDFGSLEVERRVPPQRQKVFELAKAPPAKPSETVAASPMPGIEVRLSRCAKTSAEAAGIDVAKLAGRGLVRARDIERSENEGGIDGRNIGGPGDRIVIVGGGGHTKMCIELIRDTGCYIIAGIASSVLKPGKLVLGVPVLCADRMEDLLSLREAGITLAVNGVGAADKHSLRAPVFERIIAAGLVLPALVHRSAVIESSAQIGAGTQVMAGAYIGSSATVGEDCIVNAGAVISHDCRIEDHVHVAPGSILGGNVIVGAGSLIGMGCQVFMHVRIGRDVIVANGMSVDGDVPDGSRLKHRMPSRLRDN